MAASGNQRLAVAKKPSRKSASEVIPVTTSPVDYPSRYGGESRRRPHSYSDWRSPSHAATCSRRCGCSQWGQVNVVVGFYLRNQRLHLVRVPMIGPDLNAL